MTQSIVQWFRKRIVSRIVQDVADEMAACEFDCRKSQCLHDEWSTCPNRKRVEKAVKGG
jgi:hypothetical protein